MYLYVILLILVLAMVVNTYMLGEEMYEEWRENDVIYGEWVMIGIVIGGWILCLYFCYIILFIWV